jgi:hypothetical protein
MLMSSLNKLQATAYNATNDHGLKVKLPDNEGQLIRLVMAHMLWENNFYIQGEAVANQIKNLVAKTSPNFVRSLAMVARDEFKLRHVPLLLLRELARKGQLDAATVTNTIQRPDEMSELVSIYWKDGKRPLPNQMKKGLAQAFCKFNEYQLAKWDKNSAAVSLRDVMFLTHPTPVDEAQAVLFKKVADKQLETPDTWETELSAGADKGETFTRLMLQKKLGALAFLRNLRNMIQAGVDTGLIRKYGDIVDVSKVLPFRFIAAARIVPQFEDMLESMMFRACEGMKKIRGKTVLVVDVSGSMFGRKISDKSDLDRFDAAAALAVLMRELCEEVEIFSFSNNTARVAPRRGFALVEAIHRSQQHGGTQLGKSLREIDRVTSYDRVVVITDEQSSDRPTKPKDGAKGYLLNVGTTQNGINHGAWTTITGFSEAVIKYMQILETY